MITFQKIRNSIGISLERVSNELRTILNSTDGRITGCEAVSRWERGVEECPNWSAVIQALYLSHEKLIRKK